MSEEEEEEGMSEEAKKEAKKKKSLKEKNEEIRQVRNVYITVFAASIFVYLNFINKTL